MKNNQHELCDLLNLDISSSLLSGLELRFYIECNLQNYSEIETVLPLKRLYRALGNNNCVNCLSTLYDFIDYKESFKLSDIDKQSQTFYEKLLTNLLYNPVLEMKETPTVDFKPLLIGRDVLGLVAIPYNESTNGGLCYLRRDIYEILYKFMDVNQIIRSPLFGV